MRAESLVEAPLSTLFWDEGTVPQPHRGLRDWRAIVLDAYVLQPTLSLTTRQGQRLWGMDAPTCTDVLDALVDAGVLTRTPDGQYCRLDYVGNVHPPDLL
ncbi:hypothetical protein LuPra_01437 [Luteitalea pratensis]|uniref:Uncharacterized protein n=1 Tax=Luteitalea pratensis TaxID=1855912 RepID=A0A143PJ23_LUTPR|nr:hypothetical protein [Luteitalea pratensis]AMY08243.1 hypothetical protein LuPra_01437 [Luteitalea pratensis]